MFIADQKHMDERPVTDISKDDLVGEWWIEPVGGESMNWLEATSRAIDGLRPLLIKPFTETITGYYVSRNIIPNSLHVVRFFSFVERNQSENVSEGVDKFIRQSPDIKHSQKTCHPCIQPLAIMYGGQQFEERFRRFLALNTYITLELMEKDVELARQLAITSLFWIFNKRKSYRDHFEPSFVKFSSTYKTLSNEQRDNYWEDFGVEPEHGTRWAHMYENLALGAFSPKPLKANYEYSIEEINSDYKGIYELPVGWSAPA